jgi:hypothetical protein
MWCSRPRPRAAPRTRRPLPTTREPATTTTTTTTDGTRPRARVDSISTVVERWAVVLAVTSSVDDPESGVRRMEMVVDYSYRCPLSPGDFRGSETVPGDRVSTVSTRLRLSCPLSTEAVQLTVTVLVRGTNGHGVQGSPRAFSYSCPSRGDCFPAAPRPVLAEAAGQAGVVGVSLGAEHRGHLPASQTGVRISAPCWRAGHGAWVGRCRTRAGRPPVRRSR